MNTPQLYERAPLFLLVLLTTCFCAFTFLHEHHAAQKAQSRLNRHALIIADDLWNFNQKGVVEYLKLAAEADHYESLEVVNHNGELFQSVTTSVPSPLEQSLIDLHLIPRVVLVAPVESRDNYIGWVEAVWIPETLYFQLSVFGFSFMMFLIITLYCRIYSAKQLLEIRVMERTRDLYESNKTLQKEFTERIQAEEEREKLRGQLERSRKMESLGLLAGGVAHDLNNVLSGIVSYPDLLLFDMAQDNPMRKNIEVIKESGLCAAEIVQDLLSLARRGVDNKQPVDLNWLIDEYLHSPEYNNLKKNHENIEISFTEDEDLPLIMGSPVALKKVIMNLVSNGAEAQQDGGHIALSTLHRHVEEPLDGLQIVAPGEYAVLQVHDEGQGINEEDLQRIFEPFYTRKAMGRSGTGLGLTVVWGTVEDHGGAIHVESNVNRGTTITIYFPATREVTSTLKNITATALPFGNNEKILVIDDVDYQRDIACSILRKLQYDPIAVASGEEAVEFVKDQAVDLLVLDMIMNNGIDGLETYKRISAIHPGQKAVIASGYSESDSVLRAQEIGAGSYIKKPYKLEQLGMTVWKELHDANGGATKSEGQ